jgi:hypothetical protein
MAVACCVYVFGWCMLLLLTPGNAGVYLVSTCLKMPKDGLGRIGQLESSSRTFALQYCTALNNAVREQHRSKGRAAGAWAGARVQAGTDKSGAGAGVP